MPNENEHPRYTDPDHPYSGSGLRYQNNYNLNEYHAGDGPFQFPWWAIVIGFVVWWPLGFIFIGLNAAMKNGKLGSFEQNARTRTQSYRSGPSVQEGQFRPIYAQQDQESAGKTAAAPRDAEKKRKGMALANGLTVAGVLLLLILIAVVRTLLSPKITSDYKPQVDEQESLRLAKKLSKMIQVDTTSHTGGDAPEKFRNLIGSQVNIRIIVKK